MTHQNNGECPKCAEIFNKYPKFEPKLRGWFIFFQSKYPEAHISCAGRGHAEQETKKLEGRSNASYGKSAHNYNCAIDIFVQLPKTDIYDKKWFANKVAPEVPFFLNWYGSPESDFYELPHIELREWRKLRTSGMVALVEPNPDSTDVA